MKTVLTIFGEIGVSTNTPNGLIATQVFRRYIQQVDGWGRLSRRCYVIMTATFLCSIFLELCAHTSILSINPSASATSAASFLALASFLGLCGLSLEALFHKSDSRRKTLLCLLGHIESHPELRVAYDGILKQNPYLHSRIEHERFDLKLPTYGFTP